MSHQKHFTRRAALALTAGAALALTTALPAAAEVDFAGKTIEWIIPFSEGGGSDKWSRFYAPLISAKLPGQPTVVVKNEPGAGSTKGANLFADRAEPDGLTILGTSGSTQFPYLLGDPRVKYEYKDWQVVLASPTGGVVYINPESTGVKSAADLASVMDRDFLYASQGATSLDLVPLLGFELLGLKVEGVFGMKGRGDGRLAFERGEVNIDYQTSSAYLSNVTPMVEAGTAAPLFSWGSLDDNGNIVRDPTFPDLPSFKEVYIQLKGEEPSGPAWDAWKAFFIAGFPAQKMVFLPNGTSQEIVDAYTAAFRAAIAEPDFAAASAKRLGVYPQLTGAAAQTAKEQGTEVSEETRAWVRNWLKERFNVEL